MPTTVTKPLIVCAANASSPGAVDAASQSTIQLFGMGRTETRSGDPKFYVLDDLAHAQAIVNATLARAGTTEMVIDFDHQTVYGAQPGVGGRAEAAGWVKKLYATDAGIFADVKWTDEAAQKIAAQAYRYISPVSMVERATGRVRVIINAALTNTPNLDLQAVASALGGSDFGQMELSKKEDENDMNYKAIASALGLADTVDEAAILAAIAVSKRGAETLAATASALGVDVADAKADIVAVATSLKAGVDTAPDPAKFVPVAAVAELTQSVASVQAELKDLRAEKRGAKITAASALGKLPPALKAHAETLTDEQLDTFLEALPATALGKKMVGGDPANTEGGADADELAIASMMGITADEFKAARKEEEAV
jgi:phage I-like protein